MSGSSREQQRQVIQPYVRWPTTLNPSGPEQALSEAFGACSTCIGGVDVRQTTLRARPD